MSAHVRIKDALELGVGLLSVLGDFLYLVLALLIVLMLVRCVVAGARFNPQPSRPSTFGAHIRYRWRWADARRRRGMQRQAALNASALPPTRPGEINPPSPGIRRLRARAALGRGAGDWVVVRYPH